MARFSDFSHYLVGSQKPREHSPLCKDTCSFEICVRRLKLCVLAGTMSEDMVYEHSSSYLDHIKAMIEEMENELDHMDDYDMWETWFGQLEAEFLTENRPECVTNMNALINALHNEITRLKSLKSKARVIGLLIAGAKAAGLKDIPELGFGSAEHLQDMIEYSEKQVSSMKARMDTMLTKFNFP